MENRLKLFYDAGSSLFINKGFVRTQIKDIAKEIGLSTGMLYQYFISKRDILSFILKCTIEPTFLDGDYEFPINSAMFENLDIEIIKAFEENQTVLGSHLENNADGYCLEEMLSDAFDVISKYGIGCLIIENNAEDLRALHEYYRDYRHRYFQQIKEYIKIYIDNGTFRRVEDVFYSTRAIVENMAWWGMHIMNDAFEPDKGLSIQKAKSVCMDLLLNSYRI